MLDERLGAAFRAARNLRSIWPDTTAPVPDPAAAAESACQPQWARDAGRRYGKAEFSGGDYCLSSRGRRLAGLRPGQQSWHAEYCLGETRMGVCDAYRTRVSLGRSRSRAGWVGLHSAEHFAMPGQNVAARANAKDFLDFVEEVTLADGTVVDADHAQIAAFYTQCCTAAAAKAAPAPAPVKAPAPVEQVVMVRLMPRVNVRRRGFGIIPVPQPGQLRCRHGDCCGGTNAGRLAGERATAQPQPMGFPHLPDGD